MPGCPYLRWSRAAWLEYFQRFDNEPWAVYCANYHYYTSSGGGHWSYREWLRYFRTISITEWMRWLDAWVIHGEDLSFD